MDNVRTMALSKAESDDVRLAVDAFLDNFSGDNHARRLEIADAARRWAARVDDEEYGLIPHAKYTPAPCAQEYCSCSDCAARWVRDRDGAAAAARHVELRSMDDFDDLKTDPVLSRVNELPLRAPFEGTDG